MTMPAKPTRQPGRPRSREADGAILQAALELLGEHKTVSAVSLEAIAARAGVGKATIYRRWPGKEELFTDAVARVRQPLPATDTGSLREDLVILVTAVCGEMHSPLDRAVRLLMLSDSHPEITERIRQHVFAPRIAVLEEALRRGIEAGELDPQADLEAVINLLVGGSHMYCKAGSALRPRAAAERLVDAVLNGIRPR